MEKMLTDRKTILIMILPALLIFLLFIPIPAITSIFLSLTKWNLVGTIKFIGFENFRFMIFDDYVFHIAIKNTLIFVVLSIILQLPMAFFLSNVISRMRKYGRLFRNIIFLPVTFSGVAVSLIFYFIYHPNMGLLNNFLKLFIPGINFPWLADSRTALISVIVTLAWQWTGYHMVIYLAGISTIPDEILEASRIDGANEWQITWHIIFPLLLPVIQVSTILITTSSLKSFDQIFIMTFGGPNHASEVLASHMYTKTFAQLNYGYGSALSTVLMVLCIVSTLLLNQLFKFSKSKTEY
ncbi:MAG TPA: sugar ABC transporter permease [Spirochaetia bacterium]|nr:sugar ABC transporter permease [Spirochaetia bacterium]